LTRFVATSILLAVAAFVWPQQAAQPPAVPSEPLRARASLVLVPALVRDRKGNLVYGLQSSDFQLTDDGIPQPVRLEEDSGAQPLALVVAIEAGAAIQQSGWHPGSHPQRSHPQPGEEEDRFQTLPVMVEQMAAVPHSRVAVVGFDSQPALVQGFTEQQPKIEAAIHTFDTEIEGDHGAGILDTVAYAVELLQQTPPGYRRAILLLSETNDRGSSTGIAETIRAVTETNTAIYTLSYSSGLAEASKYGSRQLPTKLAPPKPGQRPLTLPAGNAEAVSSAILNALLFGVALENTIPNLAGGCMAKDPDNPSGVATRGYDCLAQLAPPLTAAKMAALALRDGLRGNVPETIAHASGGEAFVLHDARTLERDLQSITNRLPNRYILSFVPHAPRPGLHVLEVRAGDGLQVAARTSYWVEAPR
jgi:VWFA-related protein